MAVSQHDPEIIVANEADATRGMVIVAAPAEVEHPAVPLNDADRDAFLALMNDDSEPNAALRTGAEQFKALDW